MEIRAARPTDAGKVGAILSDFTDSTPWMPRLHSRAEDVAHAGALIDRGWVTVAEVAGDVAGFCARDRDDLDALYVASDMRGRGVGSTLLRHLQGSVPYLWLWTFQANLRAQAFYLRHGFREVARTDGRDTAEGLPDIRYEWRRKEA